jgi:uncharacterized caspase-like protein
LLPLALAAMLWLLGASAATAQETLRGVALVIGNGDYEHLAPLANPPDDADAIEELLSDLGFDSVRRTDRDADDLARDLERFVEDAEDADVAILYYAGHGIEAGGENWLVPVDADISALDAATEKLVPVSDVVRRLRQTVPVTIVLLDACRDNPFPPGAVLRLEADANPVPVSAGGLSDPGRGASPTITLTRDTTSGDADSLGIVLGFAAAPGQVALDGPAGANSPYAAALVRHVSAMAGEEFGTVMRMVAEEVYLKTDGRQRPWVNESLRRLLYFGEAPEPVLGPEGEILAERRGLLLTIAALPDFSRKQVERIAGQGGVPMDAVYGMLKVLGQDTPDDPVELEKLLRDQTEELKAFLAERRLVENPDPELARLSALSDLAVAEGAIETAQRLRGEVNRRIEELSSVIEREEELIRARRTEFAAEYAKSAEISRLAFDYAGAAAEYEKAHDQIERWDDRLAWQYRKKQIEELLSHNRLHGDPQSLERSIRLALNLLVAAASLGEIELAESRLVLASARYADAQSRRDAGAYLDALDDVEAAYPVLPPGEKRAEALSWRGFILGNIAGSLQQPERYDEAIAAYKQALGEIGREDHPRQWFELQGDLGNLLAQVAMTTLDPAPLREAIGLFEQAQDLAGDGDPVTRTFFQLQLAMFKIALPQLQNPDGITGETADAIIAELAAFRAELDPRQFPLAIGMMDHSIGIMLVSKANLDNDEEALNQAVASLRGALEYRRRDTAPGEWAETNEQLAFALRRVAERSGSVEEYRETIAAFENALTVFGPSGALNRWAPLQAGLIGATRELGVLEDDVPALRKAAAAARAAVREPALADAPALRFDLSQELVWTLWELYSADGDLGHLEDQVSVLDAELAGIDANQRPDDYLDALYVIGDAAHRLGMAETGTAYLRRSVEANRKLLALHDRSDPHDFGITSYNTAKTLITIAEREDSPEPLREAISLFDDAVAHIDRGQHPLDYAHAVSDRATVLMTLLPFDRDLALFDEMRTAYEEAIGIYGREDRKAMALAWRNLGLLHLEHDKLTGSLDHHDEAVAAFRTAVEANLALGTRGELFRSAFGLGAALTDLARDGNDQALLEQAAAAYAQAVGVSPEHATPSQWASAQHELGNILLWLGNGGNDVGKLAEAEAAFRAALAIRTPEAGFTNWIYSQNALADTLTQLALRDDGTSHLEESLAAYEAMIERYPEDWTTKGRAELQWKRANALRMMGDRTGDTERLRLAADGYRATLAIGRDEEDANFHIEVGRNLGETLRRIAVASGDMQTYRQAAEAFAAALARIPDEGAEEMRAYTQRDLGFVLYPVGEAGDMAALEQSIASMSASNRHFSRETHPADWAYTTSFIARLDLIAGRRKAEAARFEKAASALREVVAIQSGAGDTYNLAFSQDTLCAALYELGRARNRKSALAEAAEACASAIPLLREHGQGAMADETEKLLAEARSALTP